MKNMFRRKDHISSLCERHLSLPAGLDLTVCVKPYKDSNHFFSCKLSFAFLRQGNYSLLLTGRDHEPVINI